MSDRTCQMELCPNWSGDGDVCPCAVLDLPPQVAERCQEFPSCTDAACPDHGWDRANPDRCTGCHAASEGWCSCPEGYSPEWQEGLHG